MLLHMCVPESKLGLDPDGVALWRAGLGYLILIGPIPPMELHMGQALSIEPPNIRG